METQKQSNGEIVKYLEFQNHFIFYEILSHTLISYVTLMQTAVISFSQMRKFGAQSLSSQLKNSEPPNLGLLIPDPCVFPSQTARSDGHVPGCTSRAVRLPMWVTMHRARSTWFFSFVAGRSFGLKPQQRMHHKSLLCMYKQRLLVQNQQPRIVDH